MIWRRCEGPAVNGRAPLAAVSKMQMEVCAVPNDFRVVHPLPEVTPFFGRDEQLELLHRSWLQGFCGVVSIEGLGGSGKSAVAGAFLRECAERNAMPDRGLVWSFYVQPDADSFLQAVYTQLRGGPTAAIGAGRLDAVLSALREARAMLVLDGLERMQSMATGNLEAAPLQDLMEALSSGDTNCLCIVTTRIPLNTDGRYVQHVSPGQLSASACRDVLKSAGVRGSDLDLDRVARDSSYHPLTLRLAAGAIAAYLDGDAARMTEFRDLEWQEMPLEEQRLLQVLKFYRDRLPSHCVRLMGYLCLLRVPFNVNLLKRLFGSRSHGLADSMTDIMVDESVTLLAHLGLLETVANESWLPHPAVRDYFVAQLQTPKLVHAVVATFLSAKEPDVVRLLEGSASELDWLEEFLYHWCESGEVSSACYLYRTHLGANRLALDEGMYARGERIVRMLLSYLPGTEEPKWWPRLQNELAIFLDFQGRVEEAAGAYLRAFRARLRQNNVKSTCHILHNLCDNAIYRGRLRLASKYAAKARKWARMAESSESLESATLYGDYVEVLRGRKAVDNTEWVVRAAPGTPSQLAFDVLYRTGHLGDACRVARDAFNQAAMLSQPVKHQTWLDQLKATFDTRLLEVEAEPLSRSRITESMVSSRQLQSVVDWARTNGHRPLLIEALLFRARLHRLRGDRDSWVRDHGEALRLARHHKLRLLEVDALIEETWWHREPSAREALSLAEDPRVDYAWGQLHARERLAELMSEDIENVQILLQMRRKLLGTDVAPLEHAAALPRIAGVASLDDYIMIPSGVLAPVEPDFACELRSMLENQDGDFVDTAFAELWNRYYQSHQDMHDSAGPQYHLAILLALAGVDRYARAMLADLMLSKDYAVAAACVDAGMEETAGRSVARLEQALSRHAERSLAYSIAHYNIARLTLRDAHIAAARQSLEKASRVAAAPREIKALMRHLDAPEIEDAARCRQQTEQLHRAIEAFIHQTGEKCPQSLETLSPHWIRLIPTCPATRAGYDYRVTATAEFSLGCTAHDNQSRDLTPAVKTSYALVRLHGRFSDIMGFTTLRVACARTGAIVE